MICDNDQQWCENCKKCVATDEGKDEVEQYDEDGELELGEMYFVKCCECKRILEQEFIAIAGWDASLRGGSWLYYDDDNAL